MMCTAAMQLVYIKVILASQQMCMNCAECDCTVETVCSVVITIIINRFSLNFKQPGLHCTTDMTTVIIRSLHQTSLLGCHILPLVSAIV